MQLPQAQAPRRFPGKPAGVCAAQPCSGCVWDSSEPQAEKAGEVSAPQALLGSLRSSSSCIRLGRTVMLSTPACFPRLIPHSVCRDEGVELALFSNCLPSPAPSYSLISNMLRSQADSFTLSPKSSTEVHCS